MRWLKAREAAAYARVSPKLLYAAVRAGRLRASRIGAGRNLVFSDEWLDQFMAASSPEPTGAPVSSPPSTRVNGRSA